MKAIAIGFLTFGKKRSSTIAKKPFFISTSILSNSKPLRKLHFFVNFSKEKYRRKISYDTIDKKHF